MTTKKRKQYPSQARLRELFDYDADGFLVWKWRDDRSNSWNKRWAGEAIGKVCVSSDLDIRRSVKIDGVKYSATDIAWIFFHSDILDGYRIRLNDKFSGICMNNLRQEKTDGKRTYHSGIVFGRSKSSKYIGVSRRPNGFYVAEAVTDGKRVRIGTFSTEEAAAASYDDFVKREHGVNWSNNNAECDDFEKYRVTRGQKQTRQQSSASGYKGVYKSEKRWVAIIQRGGKSGRKHLGRFPTKEEAARAYNIAAHEHYGEQAVLNDIPDPLGRGDIF